MTAVRCTYAAQPGKWAKKRQRKRERAAAAQLPVEVFDGARRVIRSRLINHCLGKLAGADPAVLEDLMCLLVDPQETPAQWSTPGIEEVLLAVGYQRVPGQILTPFIENNQPLDTTQAIESLSAIMQKQQDFMRPQSVARQGSEALDVGLEIKMDIDEADEVETEDISDPDSLDSKWWTDDFASLDYFEMDESEARIFLGRGSLVIVALTKVGQIPLPTVLCALVTRAEMCLRSRHASLADKLAAEIPDLKAKLAVLANLGASGVFQQGEPIALRKRRRHGDLEGLSKILRKAALLPQAGVILKFIGEQDVKSIIELSSLVRRIPLTEVQQIRLEKVLKNPGQVMGGLRRAASLSADDMKRVRESPCSGNPSEKKAVKNRAASAEPLSRKLLDFD